MKKNKHSEKDGWTRAMYNPAKKGSYLVKNSLYGYAVAYWNGKEWDNKNVIAWNCFHKTDIDTPF